MIIRPVIPIRIYQSGITIYAVTSPNYERGNRRYDNLRIRLEATVSVESHGIQVTDAIVVVGPSAGPSKSRVLCLEADQAFFKPFSDPLSEALEFRNWRTLSLYVPPDFQRSYISEV
jgi:hypothetical protein